jgi:hypothetical protein
VISQHNLRFITLQAERQMMMALGASETSVPIYETTYFHTSQGSLLVMTVLKVIQQDNLPSQIKVSS